MKKHFLVLMMPCFFGRLEVGLIGSVRDRNGNDERVHSLMGNYGVRLTDK